MGGKRCNMTLESATSVDDVKPECGGRHGSE